MPESDATFIGIVVDDGIAGDPEMAAKLEEVCPVDIYADAGGSVEIVAGNVDECVLCELCIQAAPPGKGWFAYMRIYGPEQAAFDKSWKPGDFEEISSIGRALR